MKKLLFTIIIVTLCTGCWPFTKAVPEGTTMSAKLTKSGLLKIDKDHEARTAALSAFLAGPTDSTKKTFIEADTKFVKGFKAMIVGVGKLCDAVLELK